MNQPPESCAVLRWGLVILSALYLMLVACSLALLRRVRRHEYAWRLWFNTLWFNTLMVKDAAQRAAQDN